MCTPTHAGLVSERWGASGARCTHPGSVKIEQKDGGATRLLVDLSALPKETRVIRAILSNSTIRQPRTTIRIFDVEKLDAEGKPVLGGKQLELSAPWYRFCDITAIVRRWIAEPATNLGLALVDPGNFDLDKAYIEICYEGTPKNVPPQVTQLMAVHHDGQTFLSWRELDQYQPAANEIMWMTYDTYKGRKVEGPGEGYLGPNVAGIKQGALRRLQQYQIIDPPKRTQEYPKLVRSADWPDVRYRVYRSRKAITGKTLENAELIGEADVLCAYDETMIRHSSWGEYYDKREATNNFLATYCLEDGRSLPPGSAFYVHTPAEKGSWYYAVTVVKDGTENLADVSAANSLAEPVKEKKLPTKPVLQYAIKSSVYRHQDEPMITYRYFFWLAPPLSNIPMQRPKWTLVDVPKKFKAPGPLLIGGPTDIADVIGLSVEDDLPWGGFVGYNAGLDTLRAYADSPVDYFSDRYMFHLINWVRSQYKIDPYRMQMRHTTQFCIRHPEFFKIMRSGPYEIDFDRKWNPGMSELVERLGPPELARTVDGKPAWDIFDISWYLKQEPAKDIPFFVATHGGKEGGHAVEFGWQDDPKGWAALRDARQPYVGSWGGRVSRQVRDLLDKIKWDRSIPAFSNCSIDSNPGNADPAEGDPWGQINGYLLWEYETIVDKKGRWEMTVLLSGDAFAESCTVDITPRHRNKFYPKPGSKFNWTNTSLADGKVIQSGEVVADKWGLVTLTDVVVTKGKNRLVISK